MTTSILLVNGPNLNLLGKREPHLYGSYSLGDVVLKCAAIAKKQEVELEHFQSNHEGEIIHSLHGAIEKNEGIIINAASFTHTSVGILDALNAFAGPVIEVHITNVHRRESFRRNSYVSHRADAVIVGCGVHGYELATMHILKLLRENKK